MPTSSIPYQVWYKIFFPGVKFPCLQRIWNQLKQILLVWFAFQIKPSVVDCKNNVESFRQHSNNGLQSAAPKTVLVPDRGQCDMIWYEMWGQCDLSKLYSRWLYRLLYWWNPGFHIKQSTYLYCRLYLTVHCKGPHGAV